MGKEKSNLIVRVDNRLVHGQTSVIWKQAYNYRDIIVPDDQIVSDSINKMLMEMAVQTSNASGHFIKVSDAKQLIQKLLEKYKLDLVPQSVPIFVICRNPSVVRQLIEEGVVISQVSIWNMFKKPNTKRYEGNVYMSKEDLEDVNVIKSHDCEVFLQETPYSKKQYL